MMDVNKQGQIHIHEFKAILSEKAQTNKKEDIYKIFNQASPKRNDNN